MDNVIIVPLYKSSLNKFERISLQQCFSIFSKKKIYAIKPEQLDLSSILTEFRFDNVISFNDHFFADINGYNELMLSAVFYEKFTAFNYMLIYQTDAFVFSDELKFWTSLEYDYIGAPWLRPLKNNSFINKIILKFKSYLYTKFNIKKNGLPKGKQLYNKVGNGGFSLRKISKFKEICLSKRELIEHYIDLKHPAFNEDLFWSVEVNRKQKLLNIPNYKIAIKFSIETHPNYAIKLNMNKLPFGCHAWEKNLDFWKEKIENFNYHI